MLRRRTGIVLLCLLGRTTASGQFLTATGGASSLLDTYGSKVDFQYAPVSGWLGVGWNHGLRFGALASATWRGADYAAGDRLYPFALDTDVFERGYYFDGRGLSVSRHNQAETWTVFAGSLAGEFSTSFVKTYQSERAAAAFFYERKAGARVTFHSSNVLSRGLTSIESVNIAVSRNWKLDTSAGVGAGHAMFAAATEYKNRWLTLTGSWTAADDRFQRLHAPLSVFSERRGANVRARLTPFAHLSFTLAHENIAEPLMSGPITPHISLDSVSVSISGAGFGLTTTESSSRSGSLSAQTQVFTASRRLSSRLTAYGSAVRSQNGTQPLTSFYLSTVRGRVSPRLTLDGT